MLKGHGNNGADGYEGVRGGAHGTVLGTYLHGPLLPKNAWFADWLTATALGRAAAELAPLDDALEDAAHQARAPRVSDGGAAAFRERVGFPLTSAEALPYELQHRPVRGAAAVDGGGADTMIALNDVTKRYPDGTVAVGNLTHGDARAARSPCSSGRPAAARRRRCG